MNGIGMMLLGSFDNIIDIQITILGSGRAYQTGFICLRYVPRCAVGFRKNSHSANAHFLTGTHYTYGYLATIGD